MQKKKPLPKIPKSNAVDQQKHRHSTPIVPGPSWTTTTIVESPQMMHNEDLLLSQAVAAPQSYYHDPNAYYYGPPQQPQQYYYTNWNQCNNVIDSNQEWKTSFKNSNTTRSSIAATTTLIARSDSLKIESSMSVPVPFLKNGLLPLETHFEKPYEPPSEEVIASQQQQAMLQRKISKEQVWSLDDDQAEAPHSSSILLQKLNQFSNRTTPVNTTNEQDSGAACAQIAATFLSFNNNTEKDTTTAATTASSSSNSSSSLFTPPYSVSSFSYHPTSTSTTSLNTCNQRPGPSTSTSSSNQYKLKRHCNSMPLLTTAHEFDEQQQQEEEDPSYAFSAAEKYFDQPASVSSVSTPRIPSPWGTSNSKRSFSVASNGKNNKIISRISTGSIPNLAIYTAQVPDEISLESSIANEAAAGASGRNMSKAEQYFNVHGNMQPAAAPTSDPAATNNTDSHLHEAQGPAPTKHSLSIASCSLINIRSNTKLYRRMALKTRNDETQLTYAKYLLQISKLYDKHSTTHPSNKIAPISMVSSGNAGGTNHGNHDANLTNIKKYLQETPAQTRHRLLSEAGYWIERLAKAGKPEALFIKGRWYLLGPQAEDCVLKGYEKVQEAKAFKCFLRASKGGWTEAHYELAHLWKKRGNFAKAIQCYEKGAKEQHTLSIYVSFCHHW